MRHYIVASHYQSGSSTWLRSSLKSAADLVFDLIEEETADHIALLKQEGGDLSLAQALEGKWYVEALRLYSEVTSSDEFRNRITITEVVLDSKDSGDELEPSIIDTMLDFL